MKTGKPKTNGDAALGMDAAITRRDFLGSTLLASGALLLDSLTPSELLAQQDVFTGYGGVGEYSASNGNTLQVLQAGHKIRDAAFEPLPESVIDTGEVYDCVIIGGGISGLAAALFYRRRVGANAKCLVLENHAIFGGEAKQNEFLVDGQRLIAHQGSAIYQLQEPQSFLKHFYDSIGLSTPKLTYQKWGGPLPEMPLARTPYETPGMDAGQYGFWFGANFASKNGMWVMDPVRKKLGDAPISDSARTEWLRFLSGSEVQRKKFEHPKVEGDAISRALDAITLEQHYMERFGISQDTVRTFLSPVEGGGSGLGPDALSAYSDYAFEVLHPVADETGDTDQMFPGGNATIARLMVKSLISGSIDGPATVESVSRNNVNFAALDVAGASARMRLSSTAISVQHDGDPSKASSVSVVYENKGNLFRVKARSVVMAGGSWTSKHIVKGLPEAYRQAYAQFYRSPCVMANVAVRNWKFLYALGLTGARWFGDGVGNYMEVRKLALTGNEPPTISPDSPIVLSLKVLFSYPGLPTEEQGHRGRAEMMTISFREYERRIRQQFTEMFAASGFDAEKDVAGIILNRWGHAYVNPQPGFFFGKKGKPAPREVLRSAPFGRIAFANTDLAGAMDHRFSIIEAQRAVNQLIGS